MRLRRRKPPEPGRLLHLRVPSEHGSIALNGDEVRPGTDAGWLHEQRDRRPVEVVDEFSINVAAAFWAEDEAEVEVEVWLGAAAAESDDLGEPVWVGELTTETGEIGVGDPGDPAEAVFVGPGRYRVEVFAHPRDEDTPLQHVSTRLRFVLVPL